LRIEAQQAPLFTTRVKPKPSTKQTILTPFLILIKNSTYFQYLHIKIMLGTGNDLPASTMKQDGILFIWIIESSYCISYLNALPETKVATESS